MLTRYPQLDTLNTAVVIVTCPFSNISFPHHQSQPPTVPSALRGCTPNGVAEVKVDKKAEVETSRCRLLIKQQPPSPSSRASPPTTINMNFFLNADFDRIQKTMDNLRLSGYYYEGLSWQQATLLLQNASVGTFLVRDSSDPNFLFALSVQTERGPTSVRIHYVHGQFRLDCEDSLTCFMPLFDSVVELVEYYVGLSQSTKGSLCVWLDTTGRRDLPIRMYRPLYQRVHSLQHLCRLAIVQRLRERTPNCPPARTLDELDLPNKVKQFLREYPHAH